MLPELVHVDLERRIKAKEPARVEDYLGRFPDLAGHADDLFGLVTAEFNLRQRQGAAPSLDDVCKRFPALKTRLRDWFAERPSERGEPSPEALSTGPDLAPAEPGPAPERLGRYRVVGELGRGGFGVVYRGYVEELRREVAIKVPHRHLVASPRGADAYLAEGRILAGLDHPGIVPVLDVGRTEGGACYLVSKFVEGSDLAARMRQGKLPPHEAAELVARVARALHHGHQRGLVHRDIKPANILLDARGNPVVADFGLALRDEDVGRGPGLAGTPAYMSPEQARGEGHLVDARTDVYSLGVVFYEILTGRRPFQGEALPLLDQIATREPRPPRQLDDTIPRELDRICLKAIAKRASDRYSTALDLAEDLQHWTETESAARSPWSVAEEVNPPTTDYGLRTTDPPAKPVRVVPKGLRSFDAEDADFFLDLLPGPRDRDGLPESIRFWKTRLEDTDAGRTFRVGLIYGPSGCGKSSLVKAGLLPRLAGHVVPVYVEATPEDTEARLLRALRRCCPGLPEHGGLVEALAHLRRGHGLPGDKKIVVVLDQFEQWLQGRQPDAAAPLVQALRQCDGEHVQAVLMVRDDFWLAVSRLLRELEVPLLEGHNTALVDLFDPLHARKVLCEFGRAFGRLPEKAGEQRPEQDRSGALLASDLRAR